MTTLIHVTESRVTRNSESEKLMRDQCRQAMERGGFFEIHEEYADCWWTVFKIVIPMENDS